MSEQSILPSASSPCPDTHQKRACPIRLKVALFLLTVMVLFRSRDLLNFGSSYKESSNPALGQLLIARSQSNSLHNDADLLHRSRNNNTEQSVSGPSADKAMINVRIECTLIAMSFIFFFVKQLILTKIHDCDYFYMISYTGIRSHNQSHLQILYPSSI
jgi:hypothetical protein